MAYNPQDEKEKKNTEEQLPEQGFREKKHRGIEILTQPLAVFHLEDGEFYVTDDTCTHGDASLADGEIDGCEVECPFHAGAFDIKTGEPCGAPCTIPLKTYQSIVREDKVYLVE